MKTGQGKSTIFFAHYFFGAWIRLTFPIIHLVSSSASSLIAPVGAQGLLKMSPKICTSDAEDALSGRLILHSGIRVSGPHDSSGRGHDPLLRTAQR